MVITRKDLEKGTSSERTPEENNNDNISETYSELEIILEETLEKDEDKKERESPNELRKRKHEYESEHKETKKIKYDSEQSNGTRYRPRIYRSTKDTLRAARAISIALNTTIEQLSELYPEPGSGSMEAYKLLKRTGSIYASFLQGTIREL